MLTPPTPEALKALESFTRQPRWSDFSKMIDAEIAACTDRLLGSQDLRQIGEFQGRIKALKDLQARCAEAPSLMEKLGLRASL